MTPHSTEFSLRSRRLASSSSRRGGGRPDLELEGPSDIAELLRSLVDRSPPAPPWFGGRHRLGWGTGCRPFGPRTSRATIFWFGRGNKAACSLHPSIVLSADHQTMETAMTIRAHIHTDDSNASADFDATAYFEDVA